MANDFFTTESTLTLGGSVAIVFVVCNGCQKAFNFNPKWFALAVSLVIAFIGVVAKPDCKIIDFVIGILNGFLIFCTSAGATETAGVSSTSSNPETFGGKTTAKRKRRFLTSWFN